MSFNKNTDKVSFDVAMLYKSFPELWLPLVVSDRTDWTGENATPVDNVSRLMLHYNSQAYILNCVNISCKRCSEGKCQILLKYGLLLASQQIHFPGSERQYQKKKLKTPSNLKAF